MECAVCYELFNSQSKLVSTICGHIFHHFCLEKWLNNAHNCPLCQKRMTAKGFHVVYPIFRQDEENVAALLAMKTSSDVSVTTAPTKYKGTPRKRPATASSRKSKRKATRRK